MTLSETILVLPYSFSLITVIISSICFFGLGLLFKNGLIAKSNKRVLKLEDEMLANHARILSLEKKITELETENSALRPLSELHSVRDKKFSDRELKIS
jgi:hypothetical protein